MTGFSIWTPNYYGHKPPYWENGMVWRYRVETETKWQRENTDEPAWVTAGSYQVPVRSVELPAFDVEAYLALGRANADKLPTGVAEALGPERDWADDVFRDAYAAWDPLKGNIDAAADLIRTRCRPIGNDTVTDVVAWLRADERGRGLVDYRDCWNIAAMIERGEYRNEATQ